MSGVSYALADFVTGGPIVDLPVLEGASWMAALNRPDSVGCTIDLKDDDALALDLRSASEPKKTVLLARNDDDVVLAWGIVAERVWDQDAQTLELSASGVRSAFFGHTIIAPASAVTAELTVVDPANPNLRVVNPALNTEVTGYSLGTIGKRLVAARLAWPGAPSGPFILPADEAADRTKSYEFAGFKSIESALNDLTDLENGPDFAFDAQRSPDGLSLLYVMRHGTEAQPRIGTHAGSWSIGGESSPITGLAVTDNGDDMGGVAWLSAGKTSGTALLSRTINDELVAAGYPPLDIVDTSHNDVVIQGTLDSYGAEAAAFGAKPERSLSFSVRGDATPALGAYRPGDTITLDVPEGHPYLTTSFDVRLTSVEGDETGKSIKIGCVILDG